MANLNANQRTLLTVYGDGDYAHLIAEIEALAPVADSVAELADDLIEYKCGDTLILFLWRELSDDGDTSQEAYIGRLDAAIDDIRVVMDAITAAS